MRIPDKLARLAEHIGSYPHDYRPSVLTFLTLDLEKVKKDLRLEERGRERGARGDPPADSAALDDVESDVVQFVEEEVKDAHAELHESLASYAQRLGSLDLEGTFSEIEQAALHGITSFKSAVSAGHDRIFALRRRTAELEREMTSFKQQARLERTADYPVFHWQAFYWSVIILLLLLETGGNGYLLSKGNVYGLIGGIFEAVLIAFLNLAVSMAIASAGIRQVFHRSIWRKATGLLAVVFWLAFAVALNLLVAHYREASGALLEGGGAQALRTFLAAPAGLTEFQSWVLFGIGFLFAFIALSEVLKMDDRYPGFGRLDRRLGHAFDLYAGTRQDLIEELEDIKEDAVEAMSAAKRAIGRRRGEHLAILEGRMRAIRTYEQHIRYLERTANTLLSVYREANRGARESEVPPRFKGEWKLVPPPVAPGAPPEVLSPERLEAEVARSQASLDQCIRDVHGEFEQAFGAYKRLDEILGEPYAEAA